MLVDLTKLKNNPWRDFAVDPVETDRVAALAASIKEDGFWGGIVCRRINGHVEIGAGHHRVQAAIKAGITRADIFVAEDMDDQAMIRVYARENATQRGNSAAAQLGTVAAAIRIISKGLLSGGDVRKIFLTSPKGVEILRGLLTTERGIGHDVISALVNRETEIINDGAVKQCLGMLKASGDYARIIAEVQAEIERENAKALKALARAEKEQAEAERQADEARRWEQAAEEARRAAAKIARAAREEREKKEAVAAERRAAAEAQKAEEWRKLAEKRQRDLDAEMKQFDTVKRTRDDARKAVEASGKREAEFDIAVNQILTNEHQLDVFRKLVTGPGVKEYLPVSQQVRLAKQLVAAAAQQGRELTAAFLRENVVNMVVNVKRGERKLSREEQERLERMDHLAKWKQKETNFLQAVRLLFSAAHDLHALVKTAPRGLALPISSDLRGAIKTAHKVITDLDKRL